MSSPGIYWRFGQTGAEDLKSKLADLHSEFSRGQISIGQYAQGKRELSRDTRALNNDLQVGVNVLKAEHPAILQATEALSIFSSVSHTVLSVTNAINLATMAQTNIDNQVYDLKTQRADIENQLNTLRKNGMQDSAQYQILLGKERDIDAEIANKEKEMANQRFQNGITQIASWTLIASSAAQAAPKIIVEINRVRDAWNGLMAASTIANGESMFAGLGTSILGVLIPLAVAVAAFYGAYELIRALNPKYAESMTELEGIIRNNWHVDGLTAFLVAPFVGAYLGFASLEDKMTEDLYNFINTIINAINTVPDAVNSAFGRIVIPKIQNLVPPGFSDNGQNSFYNQAIRDLNISGVGTTTATAATNPAVDAQKQGNDLAQQLVNIWTNTSNPKLDQMTLAQSLGNNTLTDIKGYTYAYQQIAQQTLQATYQQTQAQLTVKDALQAGQQSMAQKIADLKADLVKEQQNQQDIFNKNFYYMEHSNATPSDIPELMASSNKIQSISSQIDQTQKDLAASQAKLQALDNMTSGLAPVLSAIGLDPASGIGSIISGALGSYAGIGGAGITSAELAQFASTGDYGIITRAAIRDAQDRSPTDQNNINVFPDLGGATGMIPLSGFNIVTNPEGNKVYSRYTQAQIDAMNPGYVPRKSVLSGQGPTTPEYGNDPSFIAAAVGFDGDVGGMTHFIAGESGPEHVTITPQGQGGRGGGDVYISINAGTVIAERDLMNRIRAVLKQDLKDSGFNR